MEALLKDMIDGYMEGHDYELIYDDSGSPAYRRDLQDDEIEPYDLQSALEFCIEMSADLGYDEDTRVFEEALAEEVKKGRA